MLLVLLMAVQSCVAQIDGNSCTNMYAAVTEQYMLLMSVQSCVAEIDGNSCTSMYAAVTEQYMFKQILSEHLLISPLQVGLLFDKYSVKFYTVNVLC